MPRRVRIGLIILAAPVVLVALLWMALLRLGSTPWGRQRIEALVAQLTAHDVRLVGLGGDLPDHLTLQRLQLADAHGIWLQAEDLEATWQPLALLEGRVAVDSAHARRLDWTRLPVSTSTTAGHARIPDIDVHAVAVEALTLGAALAGSPATLNAHGSAHLRSLQDMQFTLAARRLDGAGTYSVQLAFDPRRMDAAFNLREPAHGPLAGVLGVPGIGTVQATGALSGPREDEHVSLQADIGALHAHASGSADLTHRSADLEYALDAGEMAPRPGLSWQQLHARGTWRGSLATAVAAGDLQLRAVSLPDGAKIGALNASLEGQAGRFSSHATVAGLVAPGLPPGWLAGPALNVDGSIRFDTPTRPFELRVTHPAISVHATGEAGTPSVTADAQLADVAPLAQALAVAVTGPLRLHATAQPAGGRLQLRVTGTGTVDSASAALHPWLRGPQSLDLRGSYAAGDVQLASATLVDQAVSLSLSGHANGPRRPGDPWAVSGQSRLVLQDLGMLLPALSGPVTVRADLGGSTAALRVAGDLHATLAARGTPPGNVTGTFDVRDLPGAPQAQLRLQGAVADQPVNLQAQLQVHPGQDVHVRLPEAAWQSLHAQGDLTLTHDLDRSTGQLQWSIANLADLNVLVGGHLAGRLSGSLHLVPPAATPGSRGAPQTTLQVLSEGIEVAGLRIDGTLTGTGPLHALQLQLAAQSPVLGAPAHVAAAGVLDAGAGSLTLTALDGQVHGVGVKLLQPASVDFAHGLAIADLRASLADAQLQVAGRILPQLQLSAELTDATAGLIDAVLPGYLASGSLKGTLALHGAPERPEGLLQLTGTNLRGSGDAGSLPPAQVSARVDLDAQGARIALHSDAGESSHLSVDGSIGWSTPLAVTASGIIDLSRLNPLLESAGRRISGTVSVDARIAGTLQAPTVAGSVQLHKGSIHDYRHGLDLSAIEGVLEGTQNELRITRLTAHAASGTISATGTLGILQGGWPLDLHFTARDAQPLSSSIVTGVVNADLTLQGTALHELTLAGGIQVNRATVEIPNSFPPNVAVLDVRRPGQQVAAPTSTGPVINLKVQVDAPRQILVRGRGLDAELGGRIQIGGTARQPTVDGGFDLQRGLFTLAGSRLNFTSGRVSFAGSDVTGKIDPTLDFTAQASALDATVTLRITGVADAPQFELTSVPQLPQDEILARLLFGESAGQLTAIQAAQIGTALVTLTGAGGGLNPLVEVQKHLGLDRLSVGSNDTGIPGSTQNTGATIEAGRYVTNRIFVDLKQNTTGATQVQVDVDLTNKLKLQTRVGTGTGTVQGTTPDNDPGSSVGLSYRFEY